MSLSSEASSGINGGGLGEAVQVMVVDGVTDIGATVNFPVGYTRTYCQGRYPR